MKLQSRQDIEAPLDFVFDQLTDFDQFERMAMRRGAEIERTDRLRSAGPGMTWRIRFRFRGKDRKIAVRHVEVQPGSFLTYGFESPNVEGTTRIELLALSPRRTRLTMAVDTRPKSLAARLVLQSLRLAKGRIQRRFDVGAGKLANLMEERWRASLRS